MARSSYVYVAQEKETGTVRLAATVKYEFLWSVDNKLGGRKHYNMYRFDDGLEGVGVWMEENEEDN